MERNEESKQLLRRIIESMAWRQLATIDILGHCLKYVTDVENKMRVATELDLGLRLFKEVHSLYGELGWTDIEVLVRDRLADIPFPASRLEFGLAYYLIGLAENVAMKSYVESSYERFAEIASAYVDAAIGRPQPTRFRAFANDPSNHPQAQVYLNRWLAIALASFGRPGSQADRRAVELGLRSKSAALLYKDFLDELQPFLRSCNLTVPPIELMELTVEGQ